MNSFAIVVHIIIFLALIISSVIDAKTMKIPNYITFPLIIIGLIYNIFFNKEFLIINLIFFIIYFVVGAFGIIGLGDIKLLMGLCLCLNYINSLYILLIACITFIIYGIFRYKKEAIYDLMCATKAILTKNIFSISKEGRKIAFAPFLTLGFIVMECFYVTKTLL